MKTCIVSDGVSVCGQKVKAKGLCSVHYQRLTRTGDLGGVERVTNDNRGAKCSSSECDRPATVKGYCQTHYSAFKRGLDTNYKIKAYGTGDGWTNKDGVTYTRKPGSRSQIAMHRVIAEQQLGRPLQKNELVKHRNNIKSDNSVGPCIMCDECICADGPHNISVQATKTVGFSQEDYVKSMSEKLGVSVEDLEALLKKKAESSK